MGAIGRSGLSPDRIVFEVTESEGIKDDKHLRNILDFCRKSGFRVALDDLGYGALNLLDALRPDFLNLHMDLVWEADREPYRVAVVSKLLEIAKDLGADHRRGGRDRGAVALTCRPWRGVRAGLLLRQAYLPAARPRLRADKKP